jgi:ADP-ribose pyrophosphatase YjhB (NUDIX family)
VCHTFLNTLQKLPGDLVYPNEDLNTAAERVLEQLTGLRGVYLEQVKHLVRLTDTR